MTVDKFGRHYSKQKYNSDVLKKNVPQILGIIVDRDNNLNIQNKRIKNVAPPREEADAVNKAYLQIQINRTQDQLKRGINTEVLSVRNHIHELKSNLKDIYDVLSANSFNIKYTYTTDN